MTGRLSVKQLIRWTSRKARDEALRIGALRARDGDTCRRCRRPIAFDLPPGHDKGPIVQTMFDAPSLEGSQLDNLCLCHGRCNAGSADMTDAVAERLRRKSEAALLSNTKKRRR